MQDKQQPNHKKGREIQPQQIQDFTQAEVSFGFQIPSHTITDLFEEVANSLKFEMIEKQINHATAIKQVQKNILQMIDCFNLVTDGNMTAIKLTIHTNEKFSKRVCKIKGLVGSKREVKRFLDRFKEKSKEANETHHVEYPGDEVQEVLGQPQNPFHLQACAAYMFHKILSNQHYGIGSSLTKQLKNYNHNFEDVQKSVDLIPLPMKSIIAIIQEIVDNLYKDFNLGRKEMEKVMPYCRISVEKYVFDKIENVICPIYRQKSGQVTSLFDEKKSKIFSEKTLREILSEANLQQKNWIFKDKIQITDYLDKNLSVSELRQITKYKKACEQIEKIKFVKNPRQKMKHFQIGFSLLKTMVFEHSKKKEQLFSMEDIIPIFIFILLLADIPDIRAELDMILDFIEFDSCDLESEKRLMLNFSDSFNFVYKDWKI